jgi:putative two-component system response regulator
VQRKPALVELGPLVRAVHERWDGSGYPDGLKGSAIPLPSRIVAVCDAFDSLTRPPGDRKPMSLENALDAVTAGWGHDFDPGIVEPFCSLIARHGDRAGRP